LDSLVFTVRRQRRRRFAGADAASANCRDIALAGRRHLQRVV